MEQKVIKQRNNLIDIFRLFCAILVVVIHTNPFAGIKGLEFITHEVLTRVAVPFFFVVAGFFYIPRLQKEKKIFGTYLIRIFITYTCWSVFYFLIKLIQLLIEGEFVLIPFLKTCCFSFVLTGSYYHFWFFPALIFSILIVATFYKLKSLKFLYIIGGVLYLLGCLGCAYYDLALNIPIISTIVQNKWFKTIRRLLLMGFPFFLLGVILNELKDKWENINLKIQMSILGCLIFVFIAEIVMVFILRIYHDITLTIFLYPLVGWIMIILCNNSTKKFDRLGNVSRFCAEFIYYIHPAIIFLIEKCTMLLFNVECSNLLMFMFVTVLSLCLGVFWGKLNRGYRKSTSGNANE